MLRKWFSLLWAVCMLIGAAGQTQAAGQTGTVHIRPEWCGSTVSGGTVSICRVGMRTENGFLLTDGLANWSIEEGELETGNWVSWLAQKDLENVIIRPVGDDGAVFYSLPAGMYLVKHPASDSQWEPFKPFFLTIPEGENWDVYRAPKVMYRGESPRTGDRPSPLIGAMGIGLSVAFLMVFVDEHRK